MDGEFFYGTCNANRLTAINSGCLGKKQVIEKKNNDPTTGEATSNRNHDVFVKAKPLNKTTMYTCACLC